MFPGNIVHVNNLEYELRLTKMTLYDPVTRENPLKRMIMTLTID